MPGSPYSDVSKEKLILRDQLAIDRTILSNERTFLAYIRTALALFATGGFVIRFFDSNLLEVLGWIFILLGIITVVIGKFRYRKMKRLIELEEKGR
jgi:putative membrane protein